MVYHSEHNVILSGNPSNKQTQPYKLEIHALVYGVPMRSYLPT